MKQNNETMSKENEFKKRAILQNLIVISLGFTLLFTAFSSMSNLQSSLNKVCH